LDWSDAIGDLGGERDFIGAHAKEMRKCSVASSGAFIDSYRKGRKREHSGAAEKRSGARCRSGRRNLAQLFFVPPQNAKSVDFRQAEVQHPQHA
jgi:hypothetical protein